MTDLNDDAVVSLHHGVARMLMREFGVSEREAAALAARPLDEHRRLFGGQKIYWRAPDRSNIVDDARSDRQNGMSYDELSRKYRRTVRTIRRWVD